MSDKTTMEKPPNVDKSLSVIIPGGLYLKLRILAAKAGMSLGGLCRELLKDGAARMAGPRKQGDR